MTPEQKIGNIIGYSMMIFGAFCIFGSLIYDFEGRYLSLIFGIGYFILGRFIRYKGKTNNI